MTRQLISTNRQLLLRHVTRSVRRAAGFVQVPLWEVAARLTVFACMSELLNGNDSTGAACPNGKPSASQATSAQLARLISFAGGAESSFGMYSPPAPRSHVRSRTLSGFFRRNVSAM